MNKRFNQYFYFGVTGVEDAIPGYANASDDVIKAFGTYKNNFKSYPEIGIAMLIHVPSNEHYARMGFCVMMKGNGLRWYAGLFPTFSIYEFLARLVDLTNDGFSLNISRIDIAMDDRTGALDLDVISEKARNFEFVSTARSRQTLCEYVNYKGDTLAGKTLYFGSRKSQAYVRIYDKAVEQGVAGHWIRVEYEFKRDTAMRLVNAMIRTCRTAQPLAEPSVRGRAA